MNKRLDFPPLTSVPHRFSFHLHKKLPKDDYELPVITSEGFAQFARWFCGAVQRQDSNYQGRVTIQHPACKIERIDSFPYGLERLAELPTTTSRVRLAMTHAHDPHSWLALEREGLTPYRMSFFGQGLDEKLVRNIQERFERNRTHYKLVL